MAAMKVGHVVLGRGKVKLFTSPSNKVALLLALRPLNLRALSCNLKLRSYSSQAEPRNLFELYQKNQSWSGNASRGQNEISRVTSESLQNHIDKEKLRFTAKEIKLDSESSVWTPKSKRVGAIGKKLGASHMFSKDGKRHIVTLVQVVDCQVIDTQLSKQDGGPDHVTQMILGADSEDMESLGEITRARFEWFMDRGLWPKKKWSGFTCTKDALLPIGTDITAAHFQPGQRVRVKGKTIDQGFQGVMKRWGMKGQPASHGQTKTHRKMGATGGGGDPGRIFPGKRMAGQMGGNYFTTPPLQVVRINTKFNVLYLLGRVPGELGDYLKVTDFYNKFSTPPPFPTHSSQEELAEDLYADQMVCLSDPSIDSFS